MFRTAILLATTAAAVALPAQAREGQPYIGVEGGVVFSDEVEVESALADTDLAYAKTKTGYDIDAVLGYDFGDFRLEGEVAYKRQGYRNLTIASPDLVPGVPAGTIYENDEDLSIITGMVNALVEFGDDDGLQVYGGGGIGVANVNFPVAVDGIGTLIDDGKTDFAWQAIAGVRYAVTENIDLGVKYRYLSVDDFSLSAVGGTPLEVDYSSHSVLASLSYNFGGRKAATPAPVAAAQPVAPPQQVVQTPPPGLPAPPPCNTGPYIVFFDWDQSAITPDAAKILDNAVSAYGKCGTSRVMLAGHTDTSGSESYNAALAARRNAAVQQYLAGQGVPATRISSEAFGESQLRVPTADGVRELQNRRVEVTYGPGSGM